MTNPYDFLVSPFIEFEFMRRGLVGTLALALGTGPVGVILMLRRMSLMGDAMAHSILPGAAVGFLFSGLNIFAMTAGGLVAGFVVAVLAGVVARTTELKEDASLAAFFLISLALGVTIVSMGGTNVDLLHFLFGSVLALDDQILLLIAGITSISLAVLALAWRPLMLECVDPGFLRSVSRAGAPAHMAFLALVVMNLVGGFHALGTLLAVGLMMVPAVVARFWARDVTAMIGVAVATAVLSGYCGLLASFHAGLPAGPAVILTAGGFYFVSLCSDPSAACCGRCSGATAIWRREVCPTGAGSPERPLSEPGRCRRVDPATPPRRRTLVMRTIVIGLAAGRGHAGMRTDMDGSRRRARLSVVRLLRIHGRGRDQLRLRHARSVPPRPSAASAARAGKTPS